MRDDVVGRSEPLDYLKASGLLHEDALALLVRVTHSDHEAIRHPANEVALVQRDRDELPARRL